MYKMPHSTSGKIFFTKAGYVIPFDKYGRGQREYCPGTNTDGDTANELNFGWYWRENGTTSLANPWSDDLEIVGEYTYGLTLPQGYKWKGGFPKLQEVKAGDYYLSMDNEVFKNALGSAEIINSGIIGQKRILLEKIEEPIVKNKILEAGRIYLTKGGWLVRINSIAGTSVYLDSRTSPGLTCSDQPAKDLPRALKNNGWLIDSRKSKPEGIDISDELEIVSEYTDSLNPEFPDPPKGYKWKHGFPKLTEVGDNEYYVNEFSSKYVCRSGSEDSEKAWLVLVPDLQSDKILVSEEAQNEIMNWKPQKGPFGSEWIEPSPESVEKLKNILASCGNVDVETPTFTVSPIKLDFSSARYDRWDVVKTYVDDLNSGFKKEKEEEMKKETAIAVSKSVGSFVWKTINYLFLETATEIGRRIGRSIRYAVFFGTLATGVGFWVAPEKTTAIIKSCLPKISISVEAPEIVR